MKSDTTDVLVVDNFNNGNDIILDNSINSEISVNFLKYLSDKIFTGVYEGDLIKTWNTVLTKGTIYREECVSDLKNASVCVTPLKTLVQNGLYKRGFSLKISYRDVVNLYDYDIRISNFLAVHDVYSREWMIDKEYQNILLKYMNLFDLWFVKYEFIGMNLMKCEIDSVNESAFIKICVNEYQNI